MARIGLLTGGGDCPGLNAVIRAVVRKGINTYGHEFVGFRYGWAGVLDVDAIDLTNETTAGILHRGGTILGTSRTNVFKEENGLERVQASLEKLRLDALIPIGGEDTLGVAGKLSDAGVNVVGVPKTIDNDLAGTDFTFGFQTAVQIATDAIDRLHTTAESHNRVIVVEVMGRHAGWIAAYCGLAGGADVVLVPERPFDIEEVCERLRRRHAQGRNFSIVVVAEGATPKDGVPVGVRHKRLVRARPARRDRDPARARDRGADGLRGAHDDPRPRAARRHARAPTTACSARASASRRSTPPARATIGKMVALRGTEIVRVPLSEALAAPKLLDPKLFETAEVFFG